MQKIKIVHLVEALGGGVYTYFINLTQVLAADPRFDVTVIYSDKREQIDPDRIAQDFHPQTNLIVIPMMREINPSGDYKAFKMIRKELLHIKPDILHVHSSKAGILGRFAHLLSRGIQAKLFYTPHGYSFLRKDVSTFKRGLFYAIEFFSQKICGGTIVACGDTELYHSKKFGKAVLVRNGINHQEIAPITKTKNSKIEKIGILARTTAQRDPALFNQLALSNPEIEFIWIGDGELRHLLTASNITITGWFKENQKGIAWLEKLDVYLQTSLWEGLPIAVLEAASRKIPVIATNIIGNKDIIKSGKTGYLFEKAEEFQTCLKALQSVEVREKMGEAAAKRNRILFDSTTNFNKLTELYLQSPR
ncbi:MULTISPECIES: glycosyltransferase [unclassified Leeuwenhoekiella]|uniref:glycosyltransferase n=1 Tax=unclassified Leeuwenhoekiella TaxID=2615029 RepID=UPI000C355E08|nr:MULTISPECIES: glycosyltransferase [unclassified Leeuwenhoekiella]MAW96012.1 glycosyl transferase family 1 [Leeuwenhoekiella sp.]|tara:strand:- start:8250 stop:9338 length:1089 start_codon:yes stop_codon:yes gene_type:complete